MATALSVVRRSSTQVAYILIDALISYTREFKSPFRISVRVAPALKPVWRATRQGLHPFHGKDLLLDDLPQASTPAYVCA